MTRCIAIDVQGSAKVAGPMQMLTKCMRFHKLLAIKHNITRFRIKGISNVYLVFAMRHVYLSFVICVCYRSSLLSVLLLSLFLLRGALHRPQRTSYPTACWDTCAHVRTYKVYNIAKSSNPILRWQYFDLNAIPGLHRPKRSMLTWNWWKSSICIKKHTIFVDFLFILLTKTINYT